MEFHEFFELMDFSHDYADDISIAKFRQLTMSQNELLTFINENKVSIVYKKRQEGVSSAISAYLLWLLINNDNYTIGMLTPNRHDREMLRQFINMNLKKLEEIFKQKGFENFILTPENHNVNYTSLSNGSEIFYWTRNQKNAMRGYKLNTIYISELSYNDDYIGIIDSIMPSLFGCNSKFIITTTDLSNIKDDIFMNGEGVSEYWMDFFSGKRFVLFEKLEKRKTDIRGYRF